MKNVFLSVAFLTTTWASMASAALIGANPGFPLLVYNSTGTTTYNAATDLFTVDATPIAIRFSVTGIPMFVTTGPSTSTANVSINVIVDENGNLVGGVPGDDLVVTGEVSDGTNSYGGALLIGEVVEFGFENTCGTTDFFDLRFAVTGGSLAPLFAGEKIAVIVDSESSNFDGSFTADFAGRAKGNIGPEPCLGTIVGCAFCLANAQISNLDTFTVSAQMIGSPDVLVTTGSSGIYRFDDVPPGQYTVVIDVPGSSSLCSESTVSVTVTCGNPAVASFCVCPFEECVDLTVDKKCLVLTPPEPACDGKVVEAVFEYTGESCDETTNDQQGKAQCSGDPNGAQPISIDVTKHSDVVSVSPSSGINVGDLVTFTATGNNLKSELQFDVLNAGFVEQSLTIHTSCSKPLGIGDQFGSMRLVELTSTNGGTRTAPEPVEPSDACEVPSSIVECGSGDTDHDHDHDKGKKNKPDELTWVYSGGGCAASDHSQPSDKASCSGSVNGTQPVSVLPDKSTPFMVNPGEQFTISRNASKKIKLTNADGTESLEIHTSCSQPLRVGDVFGSLTLVAMDGLGMGQEVVYLYTIANTGNTDITGLTIEDDKLGTISADSDVLPAGESVVVTKTAFVSDTVTNIVTVTGLRAGSVCEAEDSATVTVLPPPPPPATPFVCKKPIDALTMIWDGTAPVHIIAYKGAVGTEILADIDNITPGDEVVVSGYAGSPNNVYWEVFEAGVNGAKLGESVFHVSCSDSSMNGPEDCGTRQGNGKKNTAGRINDWLLEGMVDSTSAFDCTP